MGKEQQLLDAAAGGNLSKVEVSDNIHTYMLILSAVYSRLLLLGYTPRLGSVCQVYIYQQNIVLRSLQHLSIEQIHVTKLTYL